MDTNECVKAYKQVLGTIDKRGSQIAKIRALQPLIDDFVRLHGLTYSIIVEDLKEAGLDIKAKTLSAYLFRIRKDSLNTVDDEPISQSPNTQASSIKSNLLQDKYKHLKVERTRLETPADLKRIRNMDIDLDAYRRFEEDRRKALKEAEKQSNARKN